MRAARAAIVLVHGGGDDNRAIPHSGGLALARDLVAARYAVPTLDLRNYGESDGTSDGITFGDAEANDVIGAMDFLAAREPGLRFGALGMSMGGETVLYAAARDGRLGVAGAVGHAHAVLPARSRRVRPARHVVLRRRVRHDAARRASRARFASWRARLIRYAESTAIAIR